MLNKTCAFIADKFKVKFEILIDILVLAQLLNWLHSFYLDCCEIINWLRYLNILFVLFFSANPDPVALIVGDRFATVSGSDDAIYRFTEEIMRSQPSKKTDDDETAAGHVKNDDLEEKKIILRLVLRLKDFDDKLMQEAVKTISS